MSTLGKYGDADNTVWRPSEEMEFALRLKREQPAEYAALSPETKMSVGYYSLAKAVAQGGDAA